LAAIVNEVSPATLFTASYEHFRAYELYCAHAPNGEVHDTPELAWCIIACRYHGTVRQTNHEPPARLGRRLINSQTTCNNCIASGRLTITTDEGQPPVSSGRF
jgi:hypothetical protein